MTDFEHQNRLQNAAPAERPDTDDKTWAELYERLRKLAFNRSEPMLDMDVEKGGRFDCGVRSLRTLMGSAEIARRLTQYDEKEKTPDGEDEGDAVTDERIRDVKQRLIRQIERIEAEDMQAGDPAADAEGEGCGAHETHAGSVPGTL